MSSDRSTHRTDRGAVLPFALIFTGFAALVVVALLAFATTLLRNRPPLEERSDSYEAVQSAMNMAVTMQRSYGPEGCYPHSIGSFDINNRSVAVGCTVLQDEDDLGGRYGVITTSNTGSASLAGSSFSTSGSAVIRNGAFVQGGSLAGAASGVTLADTAQFDASNAATPGSNAYRYAMIDTSVPVDVSATASCSALYGPSIVEEAFAAPAFAPTATFVTLPSAGLDSLRIEPAPAVPARIVGAIVSGSDGSQLLFTASTAGPLDVTAPVGHTIAAVQVCHQVDVADTDPTYVPFDRTFCESPLVDAAVAGTNCIDQAWWEIAGWKPNALADYIEPMLPQIPAYPRSTTPRQVGSTNCYVFYPGRYSGPITMDGGNRYYFASGVYLFDDVVRAADGARVVGGEGMIDGCTFDAEASFLPGSPLSHDITGKGVTFLLGGAGRLEVENASFRLNERIATSSTRATSGISVMSVNSALSSPELTIPDDDRVLLPGCLASEAATDPTCTEAVTSYSSTPIEGGVVLTYAPSTLGHDDTIVSAILNGATTNTNRIELGGAVVVPNAAISVSASTSNHEASFRGGVMASTVAVNTPVAGPAATFGDEASAVYLRVRLDGSTSFEGRTYHTSVELEVDNAERYAINSWVNTLTDVPVTAPPTTTPPTTTPPTTAPPTTAPPTTAPPTTAPPTTAPPTTVPTPVDGEFLPYDYCASGQTSWTYDFGDGTWLAEYWEFESDISPRPWEDDGAGIFSQPPDASQYVSEVDENWGNSAGPITQTNYFGARYTATLNVPDHCTMQLRVGGDDGFAIFVDGVEEAANFNLHSYQTDTASVTLAPGSHTVVVTFYEWGGHARVSAEWRVS